MTPRARRICFVSTGLAKGGAETQLYRTACGLRRRGFDVHALCLLGPAYYGEKLMEAGIPVRYLRASRRSDPFTVLSRLTRALRDMRPDALAGFDYPGTIVARAAGALLRVPVVVSSIRSQRLGGPVRRLALTWTDRLADVTTTNSRMVADHLVGLGAVSASRARVIPNGLDMQRLGPHLREGRAALRRSIDVADGEFLWVAAGRFEEPKDYPNLCAAVSEIAREGGRLRVAIAGQGPLEERIRALIDGDAGLSRVITLLGQRDDVPALMAAADATVLASAWEGLPNVVLESLAVGTPAVSTDVGGVREIVGDGETGFIVPPRQPRALARAMVRMMALTASERQVMGDAGRAHVLGRFELQQVVSQWADLFTELLARAARPAALAQGAAGAHGAQPAPRRETGEGLLPAD